MDLVSRRSHYHSELELSFPWGDNSYFDKKKPLKGAQILLLHSYFSSREKKRIKYSKVFSLLESHFGNILKK